MTFPILVVTFHHLYTEKGREGVMMTSYHKGELAVQAQAGVQIEASRISKMLRPTIPPIAQNFLRNQRGWKRLGLATHWRTRFSRRPG
jgi:hypothetical protein